jgi:hypothetical protein
MEVSRRALIALTAVAATASAAMLWPRRDPRSQFELWDTPERSAIASLGDSVMRLRLVLSIRQSRRILDSVVGRYPDGKVPGVVAVGDGEAAAFVPEADRFLADLNLPTRPAMSIRILLIDQSVLLAPFPPLAIFSLLPDERGSGDCTVVRTGVPGASSIDTAEEGKQARWGFLPWSGAAGPCWYLATYGPPGAGVRSWLDSRGWDVAEALPGRHNPLLYRGVESDSTARFFFLFSDAPRIFRGGLDVLAACAFNEPALCEFLLLGARGGRQLPPGVGGSQRFFSYAGSTEARIGLPGRVSNSLLAMMVEDLGRERFAAFWSSPAPVAEAFESATGQPFRAWFQGRLKRELRSAGFPDHPQTVVWPSALAILALVLGGSLRQAHRREVR